MIKSIALLMLALLLFSSSSIPTTAQENVDYKIGPVLRYLMSSRQAAVNATVGNRYQSVDITKQTVSLDVEFSDILSEDAIAQLETDLGVAFVRIDGQVMHTDNIYPLQIPWTRVGELIARQDVLRIESSVNPFEVPPLDVSVPEIKADQVWNRMLDPTAPFTITGNGIIIADIDTGVDWQHSTFYRAGVSDNTKVWKILADKNGDGTPEEYVRGVNLASAPHDTNGHGTSVASILVGGQPGDNYVGVAPGATLLMCQHYSPGSPALGVPISVCASWAENNGAKVILYEMGGWTFQHLDGSSIEETQINTLTKHGITIVVPAGNLNVARHARGTATKAGGTITFTVATSPSVGIVYLTMLWRPSAALAFGLTTPSGASTGPLSGDCSTVIGLYNKVWSCRVGDSPRGTRQYDITIQNTNGVDSGDWDISMWSPSTDTVVDVYVNDIYGDWSGPTLFRPEFTERARTITWPSTADSAISVGSYSTRNPQDTLSGQVGDLSDWSGLGPTVDGRTKPDITAPGHYDIMAAQSQFAGYPPNVYWYFGGTSAAGPHVAGTAALMHEANPIASQLGEDHRLINDVLRSTARRDSFVTTWFWGRIPNTDWGWGKLDAMAAVSAILTVQGYDDWPWDPAPDDGWSAYALGDAVGVRFTTPQITWIYPNYSPVVKLEKALIWLQGSGEFWVRIEDANNNILREVAASVYAGPGWVEVDLSTYNIFVRGDYYIFLVWKATTSGSNITPYLGVDSDPPYYGRSVVYWGSINQYGYFPGYDVMIRSVIRQYPSLFEQMIAYSPSLWAVLPSMSGKPVPGIPNVKNAQPTDWTAEGIVAGLSKFEETRYDIDPSTTDLASGRPLAGADSLVFFGGQGVHLNVWYYDQALSPVYPNWDQNGIWFEERGVGIVSHSGIYWWDLDYGQRDMFVIQIFQEPAISPYLGRWVMIMYGYTWRGTWASALYFDKVIFPNITDFPCTWYVVEWSDSNWNGLVDPPGVDTYTIVADSGTL